MQIQVHDLIEGGNITRVGLIITITIVLQGKRANIFIFVVNNTYRCHKKHFYQFCVRPSIPILANREAIQN